ncbi:MAG: hypothetical protein K6G25_12670 [Bacteroidales bacterium]|jgi:hypothetical protein|nr:hypothetical protein [Bacteroidales bacterium]
MSKFIKGLAAVMLMVAVVFAAGCKKTDDSNDNGGNNNSPGVFANTSWQLNVEDDEVYHTMVIYSIVFGPKDEIVFSRIVSGVGTFQMDGTYTYTNGQGKAVMHNVGETVNYNFTFTVDGNTMVFHYNLRDITLTKIAG